MAARKESRLKKQHREAIQTSMLINRLQDHALGKVEMSATQVRAAESLIRKRLPDLKAIEHTGEDGAQTIFTRSVIEVVHTNLTDSPEATTSSD